MDSEAKRRFAHIYAEQKRRNKLKDAFAYLKDKVGGITIDTTTTVARRLSGHHARPRLLATDSGVPGQAVGQQSHHSAWRYARTSTGWLISTCAARG